MNVALRSVTALALALAALSASTRTHAGAFIFADEGDEESITHPNGYTGAGGPRVLSVCLRTATLPSGVSATQVENTVIKAVDTWNAQRVSTDNLGLGAINDIPAGGLDFESVLLHEMGHCVGLAHPNHASESGLSGDAANGTKSTDGANNAFNQGAGADGIHGSADDVRGDDGNLYWYASGSNDPLAYPAIIDASTFRRTLGGLGGGQLFARNGDRTVLMGLGYTNTESVMQQGQGSDEAQRRLTGEDMATIRLGAAGLDGEQGTSDDYTLALDYIGRTNNCNITVEFNSASSFAFCQVGGASITSDHVRITTAALNFSPTTNWFFSQAPNTTTTITADTPDPSATGSNYSVSVSVVVNTAAPTGPVTGRVEVRDDLGTACFVTLSAGSGSCNLAGPTAGARTLRATYLGFRGFDASTSAPASHSVGMNSATLTLSELPTATVVGQPYTVSATVSGSGGGTPTGTVAVNDGNGASCNITLASGGGNCQITSMVAGALTLTGAYSGNASYGGDQDTEAHTVNKAATTTTITSRVPASSVVGQAYVVNVSALANAPGSGGATGSVAINDGDGHSCNATLSAGVGSCSLTSTTVATRTLTATYAGNANFLASSDTESHPVARAASAITILADTPDASLPGQPISVVFALSAVAPGAGSATGSITVTASGGSESCSATLPQTNCQLTLNQVGQRVLTATYAGDARFTGSSDTETHNVTGAGSVTTISAATPDPSRVGQPLTVNFSVVPQAPAIGTPSGSVNVTVTGGNETCSATLPATSCVITLTSAATRTLTAQYSGDGNFGSSSDSETHQVLGAATSTAIGAIQPTPSLPGQPYSVFVTVSATPPGAGTPPGSVSISDGAGASCLASLSNGSGNCAITPLAAGNRTVSASYSGSPNFEASSASRAHTVRAATQLAIVSVSPAPTQPGDPASVTISIVDEADLDAPTGSITISSDLEAATCSIVLPQTSCSLVLTANGRHRLRAVYSGDDNYVLTQATRNHIVGEIPEIFTDGFESD